MHSVGRAVGFSAVKHHHCSAIKYFGTLCRTTVVSMEGSGTALFTSKRALHTPPGGFVEDPPPSFGRQNTTGELSNVNLRKKRQKRLMLKNHRKKLLPLVPRDDLSPESIKEGLRRLIKHSAVYGLQGTRKTEEVCFIGSIDEGNEGRVKAYFDQQDALWVAGSVSQEEEKTESSSRTPDSCGHSFHSSSSTVEHHPATMMDAVIQQDSAASAALTEAARTSTSNSHIFPLGFATDGGNTAEDEDKWEQRERRAERGFSVRPGSTVFGSDLDRLERDMLRDYQQRGKDLPVHDRVFAEFGSGRRAHTMQWEPSSSFDRMPASSTGALGDFPKGSHRSRNTREKEAVGSESNRNMAAYHMYAEAYREQQEQYSRRGEACSSTTGGGGINYVKTSFLKVDGGVVEEDDADAGALPATENPHFPAEAETPETSFGGHDATAEATGGDASTLAGFATQRTIVVDARTDYAAHLTTSAQKDDDDAGHPPLYDAYKQRPADTRSMEIRGADYWNDYKVRCTLEARGEVRREAFRREQLAEGAVDTSEAEYSVNKIRKETFLYFQAHPINEMIQERFVRIRQILPKGGGEGIYFSPQEYCDAPEASSSFRGSKVVEKLSMDIDIPVQEARRMARELGLDLIRIGSINTQKSDRRVIALCLIADHREHLREMLKFKMQKLGVQPPPTKQCIEVPFKGGTHPHSIRFKCVGIAKHLLHRHAIRVNLTKFGTPREGFAVMQTILDEIKRQCMQLRAFHKAGEIQADYNEIYCYLYPSTARSPKTTVEHPTPEEVLEARDFRILENEKEVYFDDLHDTVTQKQRLQYLTKLEKGTAWAEKDEGMSLQKQRAIKVMLGYIPKGNKDIYAARGDVNIPAPFRSSHPTSIQSWSYPVESNLEQASRGAATLGKRASMTISEMHDKGETPENPSQLDRFYYRVQGPALEVGELKEALGLKDNRKSGPPLGPGFATLGMANDGRSSEPGKYAAK